MKRYQFLYMLLLAALLCTFSVNTVPASQTQVQLTEERTPTALECKVLKAAADASQYSYTDLYDGFLRDVVTIAALPDDHYCVVFGPGAGDFIIIEVLEEG